MPEPRSLTKAELHEISWTEDQEVIVLPTPPVSVQFNPESLKVSLSNQKAGGDQRGGSATQYVGQGTSKLSFELWFDVTAAEPDNQSVKLMGRILFVSCWFAHMTPGLRIVR